MKGISLSDEQVTAGFFLYTEGFPIKEVGHALNICPQTIGRWIKRAGLSRTVSDSQISRWERILLETGSGYTNKLGYRVIRRARIYGRAQKLEHRFVMEQTLSRRLSQDEIVHHRNGNRADNRPENLELWVERSPAGQRVQDRVQDALETLARYSGEFV